MNATLHIYINTRAERSSATAWMNRAGIPQADRTYYSRKAAADILGDDTSARYIVTVNDRRAARTLERGLHMCGITFCAD